MFICFSFNKPYLSEKDRKILGLMAARRDAKIEEGELALYAKCTWEEDKIRREKVNDFWHKILQA